MSVVEPDALAPAREAHRAQDWQGAFDAATTAAVADPLLEAERADLLADAAWWLGRLEDCIEARELAYRGYDELGEAHRAGMCAVWLWEHHALAARPAIGGAWLRRARHALGGDPDCVEYGALLLREAETAHGSGDLDAAGASSREALALGRQLGSPDLEAEALQTIGRVLIDQGEIADGMGHLDEAMLFAVEGRLRPFSTGKVYCSLISACEEVGDLDRAAEWTDATLRWAERHPFAIFPGICRIHRAMVLKRRGALEEAEREATRACEELVSSHVGNSAAAHAEVGDICRRLGALDRAEDAFAHAQRLAGRPCAGLALLRLAQGRTAQAVSIATSCLEGTTNRLARATVLPILVQVAIAADEMDAATGAFAELAEITSTFDTPLLGATTSSARGRLELASGDAQAAAATLRNAVEQWQSLDIPFEVATALTLLGQARSECGDDAGAAESFRTAAELFENIGARLDAEALSHPSPPSLPAGLTAREVEVLRLMAAGMTNGEIAAALFLSVKTVSRHASNIFTKIAVTSRSAATAFAFEQGLVEPGTR